MILNKTKLFIYFILFYLFIIFFYNSLLHVHHMYTIKGYVFM